ncbi:MAG: hypothetical protein ACRDQZ_16975 [Mycobacteriales bacterium]
MEINPKSLDAGLKAMRAERAEPSKDLKRQLADQMRAYPHRGRVIPTTDGRQLAEADIAVTVRAAADATNQVRAGSCRIFPSRSDNGTPVPGPIRLELSISVAERVTVPATDTEVRARVRAAIEDRHGLEIDTFTLHVTDIFAE